jgi:hypothetical protein
VSFAAITLFVASQQVIPKISIYFIMTQSRSFCIHPCVWNQEVDLGVGAGSRRGRDTCKPIGK